MTSITTPHAPNQLHLIHEPIVYRSRYIVRVGCPAHNCGGRCLLIAHVENGRITRLD